MKNHTHVLLTKSRNSKSFNIIFTKKYTDRLTIIKNNCIKFHEIWMSRSQVTARHVYAGQRDEQTERRTDGTTDGRRTFVYHNTSRQNFDGRIQNLPDVLVLIVGDLFLNFSTMEPKASPVSPQPWPYDSAGYAGSPCFGISRPIKYELFIHYQKNIHNCLYKKYFLVKHNESNCGAGYASPNLFTVLSCFIDWCLFFIFSWFCWFFFDFFYGDSLSLFYKWHAVLIFNDQR